MNFVNYIKAGYPLLWVKSFEENRVMIECISQVKRETGNQYKCFSWDLADGIRPISVDDGDLQESEVIGDVPPMEPVLPLAWLDEKAEDNTILFLKDFHSFMQHDCKYATLITRKIRNLINKFKATGKTLVLVSSNLKIPTDLEKEITMVEFSLPGREDFKLVLHGLCDSLSVDYPENDTAIIDASLGMTTNEAENAYAISIAEASEFDVNVVLREKSAIIKKTGILEVVECNETINDIGGLEIMKKWFGDRAECFTERARAFGIKPPRGVILVGVPGTGKSLAIKTIGSIWGRLVLRLDFGSIFGSYVGESENNIKNVMALARAAAPCILWIDEGEKSLSGNKAGMQSHETSRRVFQILLTTMSEMKEDVFFGMTANDIQSLPPELLRRFDGKFFVDLPDATQRKEILGIHLRKVGRNLNRLSDIPKLISVCDEYSGAEIETWVKEALVCAYKSGKPDLTSEDLLETVGLITPISRLMKQEIEESRTWARAHGILNASTARESAPEPKRNRKVMVPASSSAMVIPSNPNN